MTIPRTAGLVALLLAASAGPLLAESADETRYGAQLLVTAPKLDFRNMTAKTGTGLGLFMERNLNETMVIQTRVDYIRYPETRDLAGIRSYRFLPPRPLTLAGNSAAIGVDIRHYLAAQGLPNVFLLGGLSAIRYEFTSTYLGTAVDQNGITIPGLHAFKGKTSTKCGMAAGLGYDFDRRWALALRYTAMPVDGTTFNTLETSLSVRF